MPGVGKSTVGVILAKLTGLQFLDTDLCIQLEAGATLQDILEQQGYRRLRAIEQQVLLQLPLEHCVVSTGGSVVYSDSAMQRLAAAGPVIYLRADLATLEHRVAAAPLRGIACADSQSFADVFNERTPLYQRYADLTVDATTGSADEVASSVLEAIVTGQG
tara:strand:- start:412458 stop:412940 length:483 start_codon:yes stop_codon:yes gene_type:complete